MVVNTVRLTASQFSKIDRPIFSDFKRDTAVNSSDCGEKSFSKFEVRFGTVREKLVLFNIIEKKSKVSSTRMKITDTDNDQLNY